VRVLALSAVLVVVACGSNGKSGTDGAAGGNAGLDGGVVDADGGAAGAGGDSGAASSDGGTGGVDAGAADGRVDAADASEAGTPATDAAGAPDGGPPDVSVVIFPQCASLAIDAPEAMVTNNNRGKNVDEDGFSGGAIAPGTYWLTSVTHFGAAYAGPTREIWVVDPAARTLVDASMSGTGPTYVRYALGNSSPTVLSGVPSCGATAASNWNYIASGGTLSINLRGSNDVKIFTKQP
jgi:hypothetical protein